MHLIIASHPIQATRVSEVFAKLDTFQKRNILCDVFHHLPQVIVVNLSFCKLFMTFFGEYCCSEGCGSGVVLCFPTEIIKILQSHLEFIESEIIPTIPHYHHATLTKFLRSLPLPSILENDQIRLPTPPKKQTILKKAKHVFLRRFRSGT